MDIYYRERDKKTTNNVISELKVTFDIFKKGKIPPEELGSRNRFDDLQNEPKNLCSDNAIFKDVLNIGKIVDEILINNKLKKIDINNHLIELYYKSNISSALKTNLDMIERVTIGFIEKYGAFMTIFSKITDPKLTFKVIDFLFYCYIIYEIHILYCSALKNKPITLAIFNSLYELKICKINYKDDEYSNLPNDNRDEIYDIIDERIKLLDKKMISARFLTIRDIDKDDYDDFFNERWKTIIVFSNPISVAIYKLKLELSNNTETSFSICQNPHCNNVFERESARQKYCLKYECTLSRQRQRKVKEKEKKNILNKK